MLLEGCVGFATGVRSIAANGQDRPGMLIKISSCFGEVEIGNGIKNFAGKLPVSESGGRARFNGDEISELPGSFMLCLAIVILSHRDKMAQYACCSS